MLKILLKKQMTEIFRSYFYNAKKNKAHSKKATIAYFALFILLMVVVVGGMFTFLSVVLCAPMVSAKMDWLYFALLGLISIFLGTFGSVFNTFSSLYLSKDNDLLLSLPIPVNLLMISRLLSVYLMGLLYSGSVILPAILVYLFTVTISAKVIFGSVIFLFLISVFVLTLSCALGWIVAKISLKLKHKSLITVIVSLTFIGVYYFISFQAQTLIGELIQNTALYGMQIKATAYPIYLFGMIGVGDIHAILIISAIICALFALMWILLSRSFLNIATASNNTKHKAYKEKTTKPKSISSALLFREFNRFTASPSYMLNCGLGIVFLPLAGIALLLKGDLFISILNNVFADKPGAAQIIVCAAICMLASMNNITAPSISLEGKSLWLVQTLPVTPWQVLRAKLALQLILTGIAALFCIVCIAFHYTALQFLLTIMLVMSYILFSALFGLFMGLKIPNLSWTNEIVPIKQSACVGVTLLGNFVYIVLLIVCFLITKATFIGQYGYMLAFTVATLILCALLYTWLKKKGCKLFASL